MNKEQLSMRELIENHEQERIVDLQTAVDHKLNEYVLTTQYAVLAKKYKTCTANTLFETKDQVCVFIYRNNKFKLYCSGQVTSTRRLNKVQGIITVGVMESKKKDSGRVVMKIPTHRDDIIIRISEKSRTKRGLFKRGRGRKNITAQFYK